MSSTNPSTTPQQLNMAPINPHLSSVPPLKRPSSSPEPGSKRLRREYHHHHRLQTPVRTGLLEPAITDDASVDGLLNMSIGLVLGEAGFSHAEPVAMDSLRNGVEEYMVHFLSYIRQSMASCRRMQPIPHDFEHALRRNNVSLDSLRPHLKPLRSAQPPSNSLPTPPPEEPQPRTDLPFLGPELAGASQLEKTSHIPKHFPKFPSKHTYQATPVFTTRETDPRKIREKATEEGRLGEEALRKLARAAKDGHHGLTEQREKRLWGRKNESMESMFDKTLKAVSRKAAANESSAPGMHDRNALGSKAAAKPDLSPIVNCDRGYWRKQTMEDVRKVEKKKEGKSEQRG
ncbi:hypothetical protein FQN52_002503 [Onygenales sp. PD_12]|nr:hypothetical protein FQN52_002503 [Onygenales sp. PD_12]